MYYFTSEIGTTSLQGTRLLAPSVPCSEVPLHYLTLKLGHREWGKQAGKYPDSIVTLLHCTVFTQVHDWMLVLVVMFLVVVDALILAVYTGLEASREGASPVVHHIATTGVSLVAS